LPPTLDLSAAAGTVSGQPPSASPPETPVGERAARLGPRPRPPKPQLAACDREGAFRLVSVKASVDTVTEAFTNYLERVPPIMVRSTDGLPLLLQAAQDLGPGAAEWFWLVRKDGGQGASQPGPTTADGLVVFRLKQMSTSYAQVLHFSVLEDSFMEEAIKAVKAHAFTFLPIKSIRLTMWFFKEDGEQKCHKPFEECLKQKCGFKWFQLQNVKGVRGQVMNCARKEEDPEAPVDEKSIEVCIGQVWMRGCRPSANAATKPRVERCPWSLILASGCVRQLWARDLAASGGNLVPKAPAAARDAARDDLIQALLCGDLEGMLAQFKAAGTQMEVDMSNIRPADLLVSLAKTLDSGPKGRNVPGVACEAADDAVELVKRGVCAPGFAEACAGLQVDELPAVVEAMKPREAVLGRLFIALDWMGVTACEGGGFEVPVQAAGQCSSHPQLVYYAATSEDDVFVVIIPWEGVGAAPPEKELFTACTRILRSTTPLAEPPCNAMRFDATFDVRYAVRTLQLDSAEQCGVQGGRPGDDTIHVSEFSSFSVGLGREAQGRLSSGGSKGNVANIKRPFALCLFHSDMDDLNCPLAAGLVA